MASPSRSRSRSDKRSPERRNAVPEPAEPPRWKKSEEGGGDRKGRGRPSERARSSAPTERARSRAPGGGARKNWRPEGTPGTWTCPDCKRTVNDNLCSKEQHRRSPWCLTMQLWNHGPDKPWDFCVTAGKKIARDATLEVRKGIVREVGQPSSSPSPARRDSARCRPRSPSRETVAAEDERQERFRGREDQRVRLRSHSVSCRRRRTPSRRRQTPSCVRLPRRDAAARKGDRRREEKASAPSSQAAKKAVRQDKACPPQSKTAATADQQKEESSSSYYYSSEEDPGASQPSAPAKVQKPQAQNSKAVPVKAKAGVAASAPVAADESGTQHRQQLELLNSLLKTAMETAASVQKN